MPTPFEQWLADSEYRPRQQARVQQIPDWSYVGTPAAATPEAGGGANASVLSRIFATVQTPFQAVEGAIKGAADVEQERQSGNFNLGDLLRPVTGGISAGYESANLAATGNSNAPMLSPQDLYEQYSSMKDRPETQGMTAEQLHDYVRDVRHPEYVEQLAHMSNSRKALRAGGNLAASFGLDPLTYAGGPILKAPFKALGFLKPGRAVEEAAAGIDKTLPNVPEGLSPGQAAAAVDPASIKLSGPTVPIDPTGASLISRIAPKTTESVPVGRSLTDRTLPGVPPASDTVEAAGRAAPEPSEPFVPSAQEMDNIPAPRPVEGPGINTPMGSAVEDLAAKVEANPNLPAGAAAVADEVPVPNLSAAPAHMPEETKWMYDPAVRAQAKDPAGYDSAVADMENKAAESIRDQAVYDGRRAVEAQIREEAKAEWTGTPKSPEHWIDKEILEDIDYDMSNGMTEAEAIANNADSLAVQDYRNANMEAIQARMNAVDKQIPPAVRVTPEEVAARFESLAKAPVAEKIEAGATARNTVREAIPVAGSVEEAVAKVGPDPASVLNALNAGAAEAIPATHRGVMKAIERTLDDAGQPTKTEAAPQVNPHGPIPPPQPFDVVANMALDKLGIRTANVYDRPFLSGNVKVKIDGVLHTLDIRAMAIKMLSETKWNEWRRARTQRVNVIDKTGAETPVKPPLGRADVDVLFRQPALETAERTKDIVDPVMRTIRQGGETVNKSAKSYKIGEALDKASTKAAEEGSKLDKMLSYVSKELRDREIAAQTILKNVDEYENVIANWEARLAQARKAKKSTRLIKFHINRAQEYKARTMGPVTRDEAAKGLEDARAATDKMIEDAKIQEKVLKDANDEVTRINKKHQDALNAEAEAANLERLDVETRARGFGQIPDNTPLVYGTKNPKTITYGDVKEAIEQSAQEYQDVYNLTRQYERGPIMEPGIAPERPANVTPAPPEGSAPPVSLTPIENVRDPIIQAHNNVVLAPLEYEHIPIHSDVTSPAKVKLLEDQLKEVYHKVDTDINTPQVRWGNRERYQPMSDWALRNVAKDHGKTPDFYVDIYNKAGRGQAGVKALQDAGIPDIVAGSFTIEKQAKMASAIKLIFQYNGKAGKNSIASVFNKPTKRVAGEAQTGTKSGIQYAARAAWDTLVASEVSYDSRGANFISNYWPKDPQRLTEVIRIAADDTARRLGRDVHPSEFMTYVTEKSSKILDDPEMVATIKAFWESLPFISRNFDGAQDAGRAYQWARLKEHFPSIAASQRFNANEFGVPTRSYKLNPKVKDWNIMAEPGSSIGIQRAMSQSNPNKVEAMANEAHVASRAQEPVKDAHVKLDADNGGTIDPPDDGAMLQGTPGGSGPNPGHGATNSNSGIFSMLKQLWQGEMGYNELLNLVRDRNSYGKYISTEIQNWYDHEFKMYSKEDIGKALIKFRHDTAQQAYTPLEQEIITKYTNWRSRLFEGPDSVFTKSGLTEEQLMEFMPHGGGGTELKQIMDPGGYLPPTMVRGGGAVHLLDNAPQVMSNMQNALTRALAMKHYRGDVLAKWTSPVAKGERTVAITLNGKKAYTTPEIYAMYNKHEGMLKEMLQYTPNGNKLIKELDGMQGMWKTLVTIARPGHHVRNSMGNSFMLMGGLTRGGHASVYLKDAMNLQRRYGNYGAIIKSERLKTGAMDEAELKELLSSGTVAPRSKNLKPEKMWEVNGEVVTDQMLVGKIKEKGLWQSAEVSEDTERLMSKAGGVNKKMMHLPYIRRMRQLSSLQEHAYRAAMFRGETEAFMRKGMSFEKAADKAATKARRFYPDGLTLTTYEKNVLRRFIPFYTYNRTIMGPLLEVAVTKPHMAIGPIKAQGAFGETFGGEDDGRYPDYLGASYPTGPTYTMGEGQIGMDVGSQHFDAYKLFSDPGQQVASMVSPFAAIPYSWMTGADQNGTPLRTFQDKLNMSANNAPIFNSLYPAFTGHRVGAEPDSENAKTLSWINFLTGTKQKQLNTPKNTKAYQFQLRDEARNG